MDCYDQLINLLNQALNLPMDRPACYPAGTEEWVEVLKAANEQSVLPLVVSLFDVVPEEFCPKGKPIISHYIHSERLVEKSEKRHLRMRRLALLFQSHGLDVMFLKGWTLSCRYPKPELRYFSDIDYYLFGRSKEGDAILQKRGLEVSPYYHHHTQATWDGILLENHFDFLDRENHACNRMLDDALKALAESEGHSLPLDLGDPSIGNAYRMTPTMEAIFLMRHMSAHFVSAGIELRQLYDWVLLLHQDGSRIDWPYVDDMFEKSGMMPFAHMISWIIKEKLHVCLPEYISATDGDLTERIWRDTIYPSGRDKYRKGTVRYYLREAEVFLQNRWKHRLVYPKESYFGLMLNMLRLKFKLGR